jgi:hypothetical protein
MHPSNEFMPKYPFSLNFTGLTRWLQAKAGASRHVCRAAFLPVPFSFGAFLLGMQKKSEVE